MPYARKNKADVDSLLVLEAFLIISLSLREISLMGLWEPKEERTCHFDLFGEGRARERVRELEKTSVSPFLSTEECLSIHY